jgi:hypothetical protein
MKWGGDEKGAAAKARTPSLCPWWRFFAVFSVKNP